MIKFESAVFSTSCGVSSQLPGSSLPEVVFSGRSNVGKSSLLNRILGRKALARVSSKPGKTVTINFYTLNEAFFVDLPGYGFALASKHEQRRWSELVEGYFQAERPIALVVQLIDMRHPPSADDFSMLHYLKEVGLPFVIALTKSDKLKKTAYAERLRAFEQEFSFLDGVEWIPFSSEKGEGAERLRAVIAAHVAGQESDIQNRGDGNV